jgi:hypothetical protein
VHAEASSFATMAARIRPAALAFGLVAACHVPHAASLDLRGVRLPERIVVESTELVLNGAGVRTEASIDRYVVGLYLSRPQGTFQELLADKGRKRLVVVVLRHTAAARLIEMLVEAIGANHSESEIESLKAPLDELYAMIGAVGMAQPGASIAFDYVPGAGTRILLPGGRGGGLVRGIELYHAILRAWLGHDPVDRGLRSALLRAEGGQFKQ